MNVLILKEEFHMDALKIMTEGMVKEEQPVLNIGDTVRVERGSGVSETFTVRRVSYGVGVERVFPVNSPNVTKVTVVRSGKVRRAKLYYLRDRVGKAAKVKGTV